MTTLERLTKILVDNYKVDPARLTPHEPLTALGLDSLAMAELLFLIEDEFELKFPPDAEALPTLADAVRCIDGLLAAQHSVTSAATAAAPSSATSAAPSSATSAATPERAVPPSP